MNLTPFTHLDEMKIFDRYNKVMLEDTPFPNLFSCEGDHKKNRCFKIMTIGLIFQIPSHEKGSFLSKHLFIIMRVPHPVLKVLFRLSR